MLDDETNKNWRRTWLTFINVFSDLGYQRRAWLDPLPTDGMSSWVELMCGYFDDLGLDDEYAGAIEAGLVSQQEYKALARFHHLVDKYKSPTKDDNDEGMILSCPEWEKVTAEAMQVRRNLLGLLRDPEERALLEKLL